MGVALSVTVCAPVADVPVANAKEMSATTDPVMMPIFARLLFGVASLAWEEDVLWNEAKHARTK